MQTSTCSRFVRIQKPVTKFKYIYCYLFATYKSVPLYRCRSCPPPSLTQRHETTMTCPLLFRVFHALHAAGGAGSCLSSREPSTCVFKMLPCSRSLLRSNRAIASAATLVPHLIFSLRVRIPPFSYIGSLA